jgi:Arc/MetJ-type ribon-helix-helix transcriptional regulator
MSGVEKVKVTHTFTRRTRDRVRELVSLGEVKDASAFIEQAVEAALHKHKMKHLALELEAFDDPSFVEDVARLGDDGLEDIHAELSGRD